MRGVETSQFERTCFCDSLLNKHQSQAHFLVNSAVGCLVHFQYRRLPLINSSRCWRYHIQYVSEAAAFTPLLLVQADASPVQLYLGVCVLYECTDMVRLQLHRTTNCKAQAALKSNVRPESMPHRRLAALQIIFQACRRQSAPPKRSKVFHWHVPEEVCGEYCVIFKCLCQVSTVVIAANLRILFFTNLSPKMRAHRSSKISAQDLTLIFRN